MRKKWTNNIPGVIRRQRLNGSPVNPAGHWHTGMCLLATHSASTPQAPMHGSSHLKSLQTLVSEQSFESVNNRVYNETTRWKIGSISFSVSQEGMYIRQMCMRMTLRTIIYPLSLSLYLSLFLPFFLSLPLSFQFSFYMRWNLKKKEVKK